MNRTKVLLVTGALAVTTAVGYAQLQGYSPANPLGGVEGRSFVQVLELLDRNYLYDYDKGKVLRGAINGALGALDDPFTYYEQPEENAIDAENLSGKFYGIGVVLSPAKDQGVKVQTVYQGGAAFKAGVQIGDVFLEVDGTDVSEATTTELVKLVRGKEGEPVTITFARDGKPYTVTMKRKEVPVVSVETAILKNNVGYIRLSSFYNEQASAQFRKAIARMEAAGVTQLILDMRDNGGGLLNAGVDVADQFLQDGPIVSLRYKDGDTDLYGKATDRRSDYRGDLVVLVNKNSASASEIVSGALQDAGRAYIIGEKTFGKGVAQIPFDTADGGRVAIVNSEWVTPAGRRINKEGIMPDAYVKDTRFIRPLNFMGSGVKAGTKLTLEVDGKEVEVIANEDGEFEYVGDLDLPDRPDVQVQGEALVDLDRDAQLRAALDYFKSGAVPAEYLDAKARAEAEKAVAEHQDGVKELDEVKELPNAAD